MLEVKNLSYTRQERVLFSNVAFLLPPGNALQIVGPNGVGKTTLLRVLAGLLPLQFGTISMISNHILYLGHNKNLHPALTVWQNLKFLQKISETTSSNLNLDSALQYFNLYSFKNCKTDTLSAGQQQKLSLAPLCFTNAKLWLLDEPLANVDKHTTELLLNLCSNHLQNDGMLVCATHKILPLKCSYNILELDKYA